MKLRVLDAEPAHLKAFAALEEATALADAGEVSSIGICLVLRDGSTQQLWSDAPSVGLLMSSATRLIHLLNQELDA